jgi:DNA-directed RNA polymerase subunit L/DNA-directed RNA polymerase alpha subunit
MSMFRILSKGQPFVFEFIKVDLATVNAIKRIIQTEIEVIGFQGEDDSTVDIVENTGPLHNEIIAHRIGLIPIYFSEDETDNINPDDYVFELQVENTNMTMLNVTTKDFKIKHNDILLSQKETERLFPCDPITKDWILITRLRPNEKLHIIAKAIRSTARKHSGFMPVSQCSFYFVEDPALASQTDKLLDKERAFYRNQYNDPTLIRFQIESECALSPKYLVTRAITILSDKIDKTIAELGNNDSEYIKIKQDDTTRTFIFTNEDDSLGNYLQSNMHNHYIRDKKLTAKNKTVSYVGYVCPHPLENVMHLKIGIVDGINDAEFREVLIEHCRRSLIQLEELKSQWLLS